MSDNKGSLLIELSIAIAVFSLTTAATTIAVLSARESSSRISTLRKNIYAQETNLDYAIAFGSSTSALFTTISPCLKKITASSSINLSAVLFDANKAQKLSGDCQGYSDPRNVWTNPITQTLFSLPAASSTIEFTALDSTSDILVAGGITSSTSSLNIYFFDPNNPTSVSNVITTSINALDAAGKYVYTANQGTSNQFGIIDIYQAKYIASSTLPGVSGSFPSGLSIAYSENKIYIGTHRTAGNEFHIYDVSDPSKPVWLGSIELNHNINDIAINEPYAYLATSGNVRDLIILDISNPKKIIKISELAFNGTEDALKIVWAGDKIFIGRKKPTASTHPSVISVNITNPLLPTTTATLNLPDDVTDMNFAQDKLYIATKKGLYTARQDLTDLHKISDFQAVAVDIENNTLFAAGTSSLSTLTSP
jgi:hypothetical protein